MQRITGVVNTISPIEEKRTIRNLANGTCFYGSKK